MTDAGASLSDGKDFEKRLKLLRTWTAFCQYRSGTRKIEEVMEIISPSRERLEVLATPERRPWSIRRTSSVQLSWPDGAAQPMQLNGVGRDLLTGGEGTAAETLACDHVQATIDADKHILAIETSPALPSAWALIGQHALKGYRRALAPLIENPAVAARPLALMLDDVVGTNIISGWIKVKFTPSAEPFDRRAMTDVCTGYAAGSTSFVDMSNLSRSYVVPPTEVEGDPDAYHDLGPRIEATVRRLRRIDLWREGEALMMDAMFSDSGVLTGPTHRSAIHEYRVRASATGGDGAWRLAKIEAHPGALPYRECRAAPVHLQMLIGMPLDQLRQSVLQTLRGPLGCTHLNDATRALAEASALADRLSQAVAGRESQDRR